MKKFVAYYRVSTKRQGQSGLGLEAQQHSVQSFAERNSGEIVAVFREAESGKKADRPELLKALEFSAKEEATLIVAKLDRLSRDLEFIAKLSKSKTDWVCADMPEMNTLTIGMMAVFAQHEREMISKRTKEGLARAKANGVKLGNKGNLKKGREALQESADQFASDIWEVIEPMKEAGMTQEEIVNRLNKNKIPTAKGKKWTRMQLYRVIKRAEELAEAA